HRPVDLKHHRAGVGALTLEDGDEGGPLGVTRPLVDDRLHAPVALVNGAGPGIDVDGVEPAQAGVAEMTGIDAPGDYRAARAVRRPRVELTRTAVIAVAVDEVRAFDAPVRGGRHGFLPLMLPGSRRSRGPRCRRRGRGRKCSELAPGGWPFAGAPRAADGRARRRTAGHSACGRGSRSNASRLGHRRLRP